MSTDSSPATGRPPGDGGPLWLLLALALLPAVVKGIVWGVGLEGYAWQSSYKLLQLAAPILWRWWYGRRRGPALLWPVDEPLPAVGRWLAGVGIALGLAGSAILAVLLLAGALGLDPAALRAEFDQRFVLTPAKAVLVVVYLLSLNAALEELHFRAWLDRELRAHWGAVAAALVSSAAFAAIHLFIFAGMQGVSGLLLALVFLSLWGAGIAWSWLAQRPGGIHVAWLSHGLTDAGLLTWGLWWLGYFSQNSP